MRKANYFVVKYSELFKLNQPRLGNLIPAKTI